MGSKRRIIFDIETDGLLYEVSKFHCMSTVDVDTLETKRFLDIYEATEYLDTADVIIGHNIMTYDLPALERLCGWRPMASVFDTLLAGNILYPEDTLSLETWALKLNLPVQKVQNEDWSTYTPLMGERCDSDVQINLAVYNHIMANRHIGMIDVPLELEQQVARIHAQQTIQGVVVDQDKLWALIDGLDRHKDRLQEEILIHAPWKCRIKGIAINQQDQEKKDRFTNLITKGEVKYSRAFKKSDGKYTVDTKRYFGSEYRKVKGEYTKIELLPLNLNAPAEVKELLLDLGWIPTEWNFRVEDDGTWTKTSPKLTEDSYGSLPKGLGKLIARYNTVKHRRNFLLSSDMKGGVVSRIRSDGRVSADAFTCGTPTARYRHSGAVCNIPRIRTAFGRGIRGLFGVARDSKQVGVDLAGIEARCLAHYLLKLGLPKAQQTADLILSPDKTNDFHSYNAKVWACDRDTAKTCLYALTNQRM